jgi:hypothetical protein
MMVNGQLEIDHRRGVIYFHTSEGWTLLRICRLPKPIPIINDISNPGIGDLIDITHMVGVSWGDKAIESDPYDDSKVI